MRNDQSSVSQTYHKRGSGSEASTGWAIFGNILEKTIYFDTIGLQFARV